MVNINSWNKYEKKLNYIFEKVKDHYEKKGDKSNFVKLNEEQKNAVDTLVDNIENQKSVVAATITSLLRKIIDPQQDIRYHQEGLRNPDGNKVGYSGRSLDTNVITPWLKKRFPRFAPKESGWLTRSIEQPHPFTKEFPGKIRNKKVKDAFLFILNDVEDNFVDSSSYLEYLLYRLLMKHEANVNLVSKLHCELKDSLFTIDIVLNMLKEHFSTEQSSRLPVLAIYAIYSVFMKNIKIYEDKILAPLREHTSPDKYEGFGDIEIYEIYNESKKRPFEIIEIKHGIPIDKTMIEDVLRKIEGTTIKKYYILTTAEPNFKDTNEEIFDSVHTAKIRYNVEVIPNGIYPTLKYYLRFIPDLKDFLDCYTQILKDEFEKSSNIKDCHIKSWSDILKKYHSLEG